MDNEITINGEVYVKKICNHHEVVLCKNCPNYDEIKDLEVSKPWPQEGDDYWFINGIGEAIPSLFLNKLDDEVETGRKKFGNFFQTKEEAQMYSLRIESLSKGFIPKEQYDEFWIYNFSLNHPDEATDQRMWIFDPKFPTKEECQEWYDTYGKSWEFLLNNNKK